MDAFSIILIIACLIFIIVYYYRQWKNYKEEKAKLTWPREYTDCPDYWINEGQHVCRNAYNFGDCTRKGENFSENEVVDFKAIAGGVPENDDATELRRQMNLPKAVLQKCRWAKRCNVTWEGVDKLCA